MCERVSPRVPGTHAESHRPCAARSLLCGSGRGMGGCDGREGVAVCRCVVSGDCAWPRWPVLMCAYAVATCSGACLRVAVCVWGLVGFLRTTWPRPKEARGLSTCSLEDGGQMRLSCAPPFSRFCPEVLLLAPANERKQRKLYPGSLRSSSVFSWKPGCGSAGPSAPWLWPRLPPTPGLRPASPRPGLCSPRPVPSAGAQAAQRPAALLSRLAHVYLICTHKLKAVCCFGFFTAFF